MTEPKLTPEDEFVEAQDTYFKFKRLRDRPKGEAWILLPYGRSKAGKTFFAGTAGPRTLFVNIGEGIETLQSPAFTRVCPDAKDMIVVDIRENHPEGTAHAFDLTIKAINNAFNRLENQFDTVVLDEATAFRRFATNRAMVINKRTGEQRPSRVKQFVKTDIDDYGLEMQMTEWFLGQMIPFFKERGKNFIMLAHERLIYGKPPSIGAEAPLIKIVPGFTGKAFPDTVPAYFDDVWYMEAVGSGSNIVYRATTAGSAKNPAGSRHGGIFETVEQNPNFLKMLEWIKRGSKK
jgi:hypothetical protein